MILILALLINIHAEFIPNFNEEIHTVTLTAYAEETISPTGLTRWTERRPVVGETAACPVAWRLREVWIQGYGWRLCEDTPRDDVINGDWHVDIYLPHDEAVQLGIQTVQVRMR